MQSQVCTTSSDESSPLLSIGEGVGTPSQREMCARLLTEREKVRASPASAVSQLPLAQNNPYATVAYFGVA